MLYSLLNYICFEHFQLLKVYVYIYSIVSVIIYFNNYYNFKENSLREIIHDSNYNKLNL